MSETALSNDPCAYCDTPHAALVDGELRRTFCDTHCRALYLEDQECAYCGEHPDREHVLVDEQLHRIFCDPTCRDRWLDQACVGSVEIRQCERCGRVIWDGDPYLVDMLDGAVVCAQHQAPVEAA